MRRNGVGGLGGQEHGELVEQVGGCVEPGKLPVGEPATEPPEVRRPALGHGGATEGGEADELGASVRVPRPKAEDDF